jgi:transcription antitermination protein NusB
VGKRRKGRELLVQSLYAMEIGESALQDCIDDQLERRSASSETADFVRPLGEKIEANREMLDHDLDAVLENWDPKRVGAVERAILRMAIAELRFAPDVPEKVVINEACEVARLFCDEDAVKFVNGVLDNAFAKLKEKPATDGDAP